MLVNGLGRQVIPLAIARFHACALTFSGQVLYWVQNFSGELGKGSLIDSPAPGLSIVVRL